MKNVMKKRSVTMLLALLMTLLLLTGLSCLTVSAENAKNSYAFDGVHITRESIALKVGGSYKLSLRKINAGSEKEVWTSADPTVATVSGGEVTAVSVGVTTVTVKKGDFTDSVKVTVTEGDPAHEEYAHRTELLRDFLDLRFGMFLHFNSSTYEFANIGGDWAGENRASTFDPASWNPSAMDCREWAKAAKSAGMTFAVLTTKHHDGFNLWDSAYTDYDIGSATDKTDVIKEFTDACRAEGIKPALYFSMLDIKHKITSQSCNANDIEFIKAQLTELLTNYGEIPFIIFDAWNAYWGGPNYTLLPYEEIVNLVHTLQPNCLVINISCEANNVRSEVAMFESAAGQSVPDWFDNLNISCNTPTSHWFWCQKYTNETFKTADWVLKENLDTFRKSDTVFILNVSPNQKGVLINKYTRLLSEIGASYNKVADLGKLPEGYIADYGYENNLLFHKDILTNGQEGNAHGDRAVDGYTDFSFSHESANKTPSGIAYLVGDIGYKAKLGKLYLHISSDMKAADMGKYTVYLANENPGRVTVNRMESLGYEGKYSLSEAEVFENCYTLDLEGKEARYLVIVSDSPSQLSLSEVVLTPYGVSDGKAHSLREKFDVVSHTVGSELSLPKEAIFVTADGRLTKEAITWDTAKLDLTKTGLTEVFGKSESGCTVSARIRILSAGIYAEVPVSGVVASSMWSQAEQLGWAHSRNLTDKSGLTVNAANILLSTHDNPYNGTTMWHTHEDMTTGWLVFDFGKLTKVTNALIWNHNQLNEADRGVKTMKVYYTTKANPTNADWIEIGSYTLTKAGAIEAQKATDLIAFGEVEARKIKFDLLSNYGDNSIVGLSEVMFLKEQTAGGLTLSSLNALVSEFEMVSRFDYDATRYGEAKTCYEKALALRKSGTQEEVDALVSEFSAKMTAMKSTFSEKKVVFSARYTLKIKVGEALPDRLSVKVGGVSTDAAIKWETVPEAMLSTPGSFLLGGTLEGTPYTAFAFILVEGVSKQGLDTLTEVYNTLDPEDYTAESFAVFGSALVKAKSLLAKADATQEEIDSVKAELTAAKYALVPTYGKETADPPTSTGTPDSVIKPEDTAPDTPDTKPEDPNGQNKGGNTGLIVGVIVGAIVLMAIGGGAVFFVMKKKMK